MGICGQVWTKPQILEIQYLGEISLQNEVGGSWKPWEKKALSS